ncbi:MAG: macro domain-containing protein [Acutalibacteraceae bacterium]|nr:macro domain-containing protein [Acutalibacteraceae bacterium]
MPLKIIQQDITNVECDAIVNAANPTLRGGGGVDGAIHSKAGIELLNECITLGGCNTGESKLTRGYNLPCKFVIHTVGPIWSGGNNNERNLLCSCYYNSLKLAKDNGCITVAFPLISAGVYGYPKAEALSVAVECINQFLNENDNMFVYIVIYNRSDFVINNSLISDVQQYIDNNCTSNSGNLDSINSGTTQKYTFNVNIPPSAIVEEAENSILKSPRSTFAIGSLDKWLNDVDESFAQMLLRKIDEKGITDAQCYKRANIDRKLFSKIKNNPRYNPGKKTVLAFAISLELSLTETREMLLTAGYALSHSNKFDIIIEYFIVNQNYNINEINEVLFEFDQCLLGA